MNTKPVAGLSKISLSVALCLSFAASAQAQTRGDWSMTGGNAGQSGWQKAETILSPKTVPTQFKFLWKISLGTPAGAAQTFQEPLLASRLINAQGFKDFVYVTSADTLYGIDSELGTLLWQKQYPIAKSTCGPSSVSTIIEPPAVINFNARRAPGSSPPPPAEPLAPSARRLGVPAGGGGFGLKGIYALTSDGMLHEQVLTTGADFAPPVKFLPALASPSALNILGKTIYTANLKACPGAPAGVSAVDVSAAAYPVTAFDAKSAPRSLTGPVLAPDGTAFLVTGPGGPHPNSIVALGKDMSVKDWYTPATAPVGASAVSPVLFSYKNRQLLAAPGKDGSFALLDAASLGGPDHHTALSETAALSKPGQKHTWDSLATWQAADGATWVLASISTAVSIPSLKGETPHGAIVAFKIEDTNGKPVLTPAWISHDMVNPAPPRIANGVVLALAAGDPSTHATLSVLNAATGEELFSSHDTIPTYTHLSGVAVGDGHAYFTDHTGVLYAFGIALEH